MNKRLELVALSGVPLIEPGDDISEVIVSAIQREGMALQNSDVIVIAQKIISKAENRYVRLSTVEPGEQARQLALAVDKDPRLVELILRESDEVIRYRPGVLIVAHRLGYILANAGIDRSNITLTSAVNSEHNHSSYNDSEDETVLLLPVNPDASCSRLKAHLDRVFGVTTAVIINDSVGRAWRSGTVGIALGSAGLPALTDLRGQPDLTGRPLAVSETGFADEIASAASLLMGEGSEGQPVVIVRGLNWDAPENSAAALIRQPQFDLFR